MTVRDAQGSVAITATLVAVGSTSVTFDLALDTHVGSLDAVDLKGLATLRVDAGPELKPSVWGPAAGGHHRTGRLSFEVKPAPSGASTLTLTIKGVGGATSRVFRWTLAAKER
ncbi:MAG TPA: hypothetical protein VHN99_04735 [Deinococcales bacterium]|nr:hypothetical protein [Deinococcales bacterium]